MDPLWGLLPCAPKTADILVRTARTLFALHMSSYFPIFIYFSTGAYVWIDAIQNRWINNYKIHGQKMKWYLIFINLYLWIFCFIYVCWPLHITKSIYLFESCNSIFVQQWCLILKDAYVRGSGRTYHRLWGNYTVWYSTPNFCKIYAVFIFFCFLIYRLILKFSFPIIIVYYIIYY